jgi:hypothetical protein
MSDAPKITLAFLSWNRLHYLKATLLSARECIQYPNIQWIVSDNNSNEPGLREWLEEQEWIDHLIFKTQSHAAAMNEMMELTEGEYVMIWPEDVQFTLRGEWMQEMVSFLDEHHEIGSLCMDYARQSTLRSIRKPSILTYKDRFLDEIWRYRHQFRRSKVITASSGMKYMTFGWIKSGVCGSGIPSLTRTALWRELGPWRALKNRKETGLIDSSLGAEDDMVQRFYATKKPLQGAMPFVPVCADIVTDPLGCKAKVRGQYRYGVYMPPQQGDYYYRIRDWGDFKNYTGEYPMDFAQGVETIGYEMPVDGNGERLKASFNASVKFDMNTQEYIPFPLVSQNQPS